MEVRNKDKGNMNEPTYCKSCGAYIPVGHKKCLACGFPVEIPSLGGDKDKVETVPLDGVFYAISENYYSKGKPDLDLDKVFSKTWFTVKFNGNTSTFYLGSNPKVVCEDRELSGRTTDGRIQRNISTKRKIKLTLIER